MDGGTASQRRPIGRNKQTKKKEQVDRRGRGELQEEERGDGTRPPLIGT